MNAQVAEPVIHGTPRQSSYLQRLVTELGFASIPAACADLGVPVPRTVDETTRVITQLEARKGGAEVAGAKEPAKVRFKTARHLRRIDAGESPMPEDLDEDALWVVQRLAKLREVEALVGTPAPRVPINRGGPILMEHLVSHFGSIEAVAAAFEVSVPTVKAWGSELPAARRYEAQVKTGGFVCA